MNLFMMSLTVPLNRGRQHPAIDSSTEYRPGATSNCPQNVKNVTLTTDQATLQYHKNLESRSQSEVREGQSPVSFRYVLGKRQVGARSVNGPCQSDLFSLDYVYEDFRAEGGCISFRMESFRERIMVALLQSLSNFLKGYDQGLYADC
jgi:hypothetical protein